MNIFSMTGFARTSGHCELGDTNFDWVCELKSVNGKNFDFKIKLPYEMEQFSNVFKSTAQKYFGRGTFSAFVELNFDKSGKVKVNQELLNMLLNIASKMTNVAQPTAGELLAIPGVVEQENFSFDEEQLMQLTELLQLGFEDCCKKLQNDRLAEGEKIGVALQALLQKIKVIVEKIELIAQNEPQKIAERIRKQINDFLAENTVSEERLAQEIVFLVNRVDIREEIDRLKTHIITAEELLSQGKNVGRRLDFLCQEFNREANTTCSKAWQVEIVNLAMELKTIVEQLREQVQNVE
ncbi:MAG: YicC family protein [Alphaproteobacteria bacterium]|nr:YicC family protein [Alphaproteobacteria bacterium]